MSPSTASGALLLSLEKDLSAEVKAFIPAGDRVEAEWKQGNQAWDGGAFSLLCPGALGLPGLALPGTDT